MTVYGPRLYFGPASDDSSYSGATLKVTTPETKEHRPMTEPVWTKIANGRYEFTVPAAEIEATETARWIVTRMASSRWEVISVKPSGERRRHGASYTLRQGQEFVASAHRFFLTSDPSVPIA